MKAKCPNIIYIMADDMGYGDLSCYGAEKISTPNIDRVANEGMRFTDAHSSSAVCTPSRYSVLTGRYCWRTSLKEHVIGGFSLPLIDPARPTIASMLKESGYATAAVGKWHVGLEWQAKEGQKIDPDNWADEGYVDYSKPIIGGPRRLGFDYFFGIAGSLDMPPYCFIENDHTVGIPDQEKSPYNAQQKTGFMTPGWKDEEVDIHFAQKATSFIEQHHSKNPDQPFFLYLTPSAPHRPCMPTFTKGKSQAGPRGDMVMVVDWVVSQVMETLDRLALTDDTLLIITSDNGARPADTDGETHDHLSCGKLRGYKGDIWEGGHRVPFIARWPGHIPAGAESNELICLADMMATFAAILNVQLPDYTAEDSVSILPALQGSPVEEALHKAVVHHSVFGMFAIRQDQWKAIFGKGSGGFITHDTTTTRTAIPPADESPAPGQLYNLDADLTEKNNLWLEQPNRVEAMTNLMDGYRNTGRSRD